jgi:hypothetical protein
MATDNGECTYEQMYYDCTLNCLNDSDGDGTCDELEVLGCTDVTACNFDAEATENEGCTYPANYYNCDNECINDADQDGVCDELEIIGCTDVDACNYDPNATDEGLCEYVDIDINYNNESNSLSSSSNLNITYQWYYNNEIIDGATDKSLLVDQNGTYMLQVYDLDNDCYGTATNTITDLSIVNFDHKTLVTPNPASNHININLNSYDYYELSLIDNMGRTVLEHTNLAKQINLNGIKPGTYSLSIKHKKRRHSSKLVVLPL